MKVQKETIKFLAVLLAVVAVLVAAVVLVVKNNNLNKEIKNTMDEAGKKLNEDTDTTKVNLEVENKDDDGNTGDKATEQTDR